MKLFQACYTQFAKDIFKSKIEDLNLTKIVDLSAKYNNITAGFMTGITDVNAMCNITCPIEGITDSAHKLLITEAKCALRARQTYNQCSECKIKDVCHSFAKQSTPGYNYTVKDVSVYLFGLMNKSLYSMKSPSLQLEYESFINNSRVWGSSMRVVAVLHQIMKLDDATLKEMNDEANKVTQLLIDPKPVNVEHPDSIDQLVNNLFISPKSPMKKKILMTYFSTDLKYHVKKRRELHENKRFNPKARNEEADEDDDQNTRRPRKYEKPVERFAKKFIEDENVENTKVQEEGKEETKNTESPKKEYPKREYTNKEYPKKEYQPREYKPREYKPREYQPREYPKREYPKREYQPRGEYQPREYPKKDFQSRGPQNNETQSEEHPRREYNNRERSYPPRRDGQYDGKPRFKRDYDNKEEGRSDPRRNRSENSYGDRRPRSYSDNRERDDGNRKDYRDTRSYKPRTEYDRKDRPIQKISEYSNTEDKQSTHTENKREPMPNKEMHAKPQASNPEVSKVASPTKVQPNLKPSNQENMSDSTKKLTLKAKKY